LPFPTPEDLRFFHQDDDVVDLVGTHPFTPVERHQPTTKDELVSAVKQSSRLSREVRALGSAWSLSSVAVAPYVIDTLYLRSHLSPPHGGSGYLNPGRLAPGATNVLGAFCAHHSIEVSNRNFVHVEAGIKIRHLLEDLKSCGLALATMGAGAGQSLAGALSTSTHGADFMVPPLVEWVRALHLVGPLGREWWLTPANSVFTGGEVLQLSGWPAWGEILANDDAFNAAKVAVGRMGVIYSMILEVVEPYTLIEVTHVGVGAKPTPPPSQIDLDDGQLFAGNRRIVAPPVQRISTRGEVFATNGGKSQGQVFTNTDLDKNSWPNVRAQLSNSGVAEGRGFGIFDTPITNLNSGWLREVVVEPTVSAIIEAFRSKALAGAATEPQSYWGLIAIDQIALSLADEFYMGLTSQDRERLDAAAVPIFGSGHLRSTCEVLGLTAFVIRQMGLQQLEAGLQASPATPLRHLNVTVSLATPDVCWITRRWALPGVIGSANLGRKKLDDVELALRQPDWTPGTDPMPVLTLVSNQIVRKVILGIDNVGAQHDLGSDILNDFFVPFVPPVLGGVAVRQIAVNIVLIPLLRFIEREIPRISQAVIAAKGTSGEALFLFLYNIVTDTDAAVRERLRGPIVSTVTGVIGTNAYVNPVRAGESNDVLDTHSYRLDYTACGDSAEYLFDAAGDGYLAFADAVVALSRSGSETPIFGYMGIRFTPRASALIAMQRFELTASVEVATARSRTDPVYPEFWAAVHEAARAHGGIPHWGQQFIASAGDLSAYYGEDLERWRQVLAELSVDDPEAFSTAFTRDHGLEPSGAAGVLLYDALTAFLMALEGATDT
jgi:hypothetical protein